MPFISPSLPVFAGESVIRFLDTAGDGSGTKTAIVDYSGVATPFFIAPPANKVYILTGLLIQLSDAGAFGQSEYGNLGIALTNGLLIRVKRAGTVIRDLLDGDPIKINDKFFHHSYESDVHAFAGGVNTLRCRLINTTGTYNAVQLNGSLSDTLEVMCNDNFTGLIDHTFKAFGFAL